MAILRGFSKVGSDFRSSTREVEDEWDGEMGVLSVFRGW